MPQTIFYSTKNIAKKPQTILQAPFQVFMQFFHILICKGYSCAQKFTCIHRGHECHGNFGLLIFELFFFQSEKHTSLNTFKLYAPKS